MNEFVSMVNLCNAGQLAFIILWVIVISLLIWIIVVMLIKNVMYYTKTKKSNKETFKKYNFKPKH